MSNKTVPPAWADIWRQGLDFVFRSPCPLCLRVASPVFCRDCNQKLLGCRRPVTEIKVPDLPPLYCWGSYEGALKQSLAKLKYDHQRRIAEPLGHWLAELWQPPIMRSRVVIPIPLHRDREQQRGYNQADGTIVAIAGINPSPCHNGPVRALSLRPLSKPAKRLQHWS
jgi:predicted amidophosphoribosyltransferase